jgi:hypothetical protein
VSGVRRHLDRQDLPTLAGAADDLELHEAGVLAGRPIELVADAAALVVRAPDVEASGRLLGGELADGQSTLDPGELHVDALTLELGGLRPVQHDVELEPVVDRPLAAHLDTQVGDGREVGWLDGDGVGIQPIGIAPHSRGCRRRGSQSRAQGGDNRECQ